MTTQEVTETTLGGFTIGKETFTLTRVEFTNTGNSELHLYSNRESQYRRPSFWYSERIGGYLKNDPHTEGAYRFSSQSGTVLRRKGREVQVMLCDGVFTLAN